MERVGLGSSAALLAVAVTAMPLVYPAAAQRITFGPTIGVLLPLAPLQEWSFGYFPPCDIDPCGIDARMTLDPGLSLGLSATVSLTKSLGVEMGFATTSTTRRAEFVFQSEPFGSAEGGARYSVAIVRAKVEQSLSSTATFGVALGASHTVVSGGALATSLGDSVGALHAASWGASLAASIDFTMWRRSHVQLTIADNVYRSEPIPGTATGSFQHDLQISMALRWAVKQ